MHISYHAFLNPKRFTPSKGLSNFKTCKNYFLPIFIQLVLSKQHHPLQLPLIQGYKHIVFFFNQIHMQFVVVVAVVIVDVDVGRWTEGANELAPPPVYASCQLAKLVWLHFYYKANRNNNKKRHLGSTGKSVRLSLPLQVRDRRIGDWFG